MSLELVLLILFILAELFEVAWQKSPTLLIMLMKIYAYYKKSPYLLYIMHPSYVFSLYLFYLSNYNLWILLILVIKSIDILFKVTLIQKVFMQDSLSEEMKMILRQPLHPIMLTMGLMLYPYLLYLAIF